jgi:hypothetical protein
MKSKIPWVGFNSLCEDIRICNTHFRGVADTLYDYGVHRVSVYPLNRFDPPRHPLQPLPRTNPSPFDVRQLITQAIFIIWANFL